MAAKGIINQKCQLPENGKILYISLFFKIINLTLSIRCFLRFQF